MSRADLRQDFALRRLPYIWARYDPLEALERTEVQAELLSEPARLERGEELVLRFDPSVDKASGNYLHLRVRPGELIDESSMNAPRLAVEYGDGVMGRFELELVRPVHEYDRRVALPIQRGSERLHNAETVVFKRRGVYKATGPDPYIHRLFDLEELPPIARIDGIYLLLDYRSTSSGELQVFFAFDGHWFDAAHSVRAKIESTIENDEPRRIAVPLLTNDGIHRLSDIRFDFPKGLFEPVSVEMVRQLPEDEDYLVRLSTQWAWASQKVSELRLRASGPVELTGATLRRGD